MDQTFGVLFSNSEEFQGLPSWAFTAIYDHLQGNARADFAPTNHCANSEPWHLA